MFRNAGRCLIPLGLAAGAAVWGCTRRPAAGPPGTPFSESGLSVLPDGASPGMPVRLIVRKPLFAKDRTADIRIGDQPAPLLKVLSATEAETQVPAGVAPGPSTVVVKGTDREVTAPLTVLPATVQRLVLSIDGGKVELLSAQPVAGEVTGTSSPDDPRLSFDLLDAGGRVVYRGAIPHPAARVEVFDTPPREGGAIRGEAGHGHAQVFAIKVPSWAAGVAERAAAGPVLRFFEEPGRVTDAGRPAAAPADAARQPARKAVGEIRLPSGGAAR